VSSEFVQDFEKISKDYWLRLPDTQSKEKKQSLVLQRFHDWKGYPTRAEKRKGSQPPKKSEGERKEPKHLEIAGSAAFTCLWPETWDRLGGKRQEP